MPKPEPILTAIRAAYEQAKQAEGLNQAGLAQLTGLTPARVSEVLAGKVDPRLSSVEKIAYALRDYLRIESV